MNRDLASVLVHTPVVNPTLKNPAAGLPQIWGRQMTRRGEGGEVQTNPKIALKPRGSVGRELTPPPAIQRGLERKAQGQIANTGHKVALKAEDIKDFSLKR